MCTYLRPLLRWLLVFGLGLPCAAAELRLTTLISDHAVLQRQVPIHVWGSSAPGETVQVELHRQIRQATASNYGEWELWLTPEAAGGPYTLTVSSGEKSKQRVVVEDLLIGDVWLASGQSNMEMPLRGFPPQAVIKNSAAEISSALQPHIRLLRVDRATSNIPLHQIPNRWTLCTPESAADFSAIGYFFARSLSAEQHVPIGIIDSTWGGTPIESWMSLNALGDDPSIMGVYATRARFADEQSHLLQVQAEEQREDAAAAQAHQPAPTHPWHPSEDSRVPGAIYNGMIAPLTPYSIKGFLWYQGETNSTPNRALLYRRLFPAMIEDWRAHWHQGNLPFLFVQISSFRSEHDDWGTIRDAQRRTLAVTNTAMAVSLDVGDPANVHPPDKQTVADRLVLAARGLVYRESVHYAGPTFRQATTEPGGMRIWFEDAADGLHVAPSFGAEFDRSFELAGDDHKFVPAHAVLEGDTVRVTSTEVKSPVFVRYAWANESKGGLQDGSGLPAPTFTSE